MLRHRICVFNLPHPLSNLPDLVTALPGHAQLRRDVNIKQYLKEMGAQLGLPFSGIFKSDTNARVMKNYLGDVGEFDGSNTG